MSATPAEWEAAETPEKPYDEMDYWDYIQGPHPLDLEDQNDWIDDDAPDGAYFAMMEEAA